MSLGNESGIASPDISGHPSQVAAFMTKTEPTEAIGQLVAMQLGPYPRLHFFTLSTALGQDLEDGEVGCVF